MNINLQKRLRNYGFWVALASFITLLLPQFGVHINLGEYDEIVKGALGLAVLLGIINDPTTDSKGFGDDQ